MLIGFGPHAKRIYYPISIRDGDTYGFQICCAVDIDEKRTDITTYLQKNKSDTLPMYFIPKEKQTIGFLHEAVQKELDVMVQKYHIQGVIIATEPRVHKQYATWALHRGLSILMDKPISIYKDISTNSKLAKKLITDYDDLLSSYLKAKKAHPSLMFSLMAQRRFHPAYQKVKSLIKNIFEKTNCPVTSIQSFHGDGQWRLPHEIKSISYHGYNEGYGKCAHSGYHFFDIVPWFLQAAVNNDKYYNNVDIFTSFVRPVDHLQQLNINDYKTLFQDFSKGKTSKQRHGKTLYSQYGEIDAFSSFSFKKDNHILTLGSINLAHNSFSQRGWLSVEGKDLYKGNGRLRHETHMIEQGPFQAISFQSYQSREVDPGKQIEIYETGGEYHLDIHVFRNSSYNPRWQTYKKYSIKDLSPRIMKGKSRGHQEDARRASVLEFISCFRGKRIDPLSDLSDHKYSTLLLSGVYQSAVRRTQGKNPLVNIRYDD